MGMASYVVDAVVLEGRSAREVVKAHGISKTWIYELIAGYRAGGYEGLSPARADALRCGALQPHFRVRGDKAGKVSPRYDSRLYRIGLGRAPKGRSIKLPIADRDAHVIDSNGELIRELTLDPDRNYQPLTPA